MEKLYLVDGMSLVFRAYHALASTGLKSASGEPTAAVFGFVNIITSLIEKEKPERIIVVFDRKEPTFRHIKYPLYKANRDEFPEELVPQMTRIKEFLDYANIPRTELAGYEADDVIGTLSKVASDKGNEVVCITADKDFYQLVNDKVKLYKPSRVKRDDFDIVDIEAVNKKFGVSPDKVIDVLAILGDTSDNVPGVKGIGEKTAIPLIQQYGTVENLYEHINEIKRQAVKDKLIENKDNALLSKDLVTIVTDAPIDLSYLDAKINNPDYKKIDVFFTTLGFRTIREKWLKKAQKNEVLIVNGQKTKDRSQKTEDGKYPITNYELRITNDLTDNGQLITEDELTISNSQFTVGEESTVVNYQSTVETIKDIPKKYTLVDDEDNFKAMLSELGQPEILSVDIETSSLDRLTCEIVGISLSAYENRAFYIAVLDDTPKKKKQPFYNENGQGDLFQISVSEENEDVSEPAFTAIPITKIMNDLIGLLGNKKIGKCGQNIKFDAFILSRYGIEVTPIVFDSMIASYLLNPDEKHNLDALSQKWLNYNPIPISSLIGEKKSKQISMKDVDPKEISDYACEDADLALKLRNVLKKELEKEKLDRLANEIEIPLIEVLTKMEQNGISIDTHFLRELASQINIEIKELSKKIFEEAGTEFNIDSPKQMGHILFEKLMIPPTKKTKTGYSTDVQVLTELAGIYPIANLILEYRQLVKLISTYVEALPKIINPETGRIHTTYNQTIASTGRLSSIEPNLQNIPIRTEIGSKVRMAFVPENEDSVILSADYSQVELRIMAYYCQDDYLISAFKRGLDIHATTAANLFDKRLDEVDSNMRRIAKTVNFGIMYGLGSFGLAQRLGINRTEGKEIIDNYFRKYPGIKKYMDETINSTRKKGYAETLLGRRRYFPDILSRNNNIRTGAERAAINMPIQGTASDILKIAMLKVDQAMKSKNLKSLMMLQVHDELVFEVPKFEIEIMKELVKKEMESAFSLGEVPLIAEVGIGNNWFEAH
ncbi:MAG: DNA polymerase I [bacterium]